MDGINKHSYILDVGCGIGEPAFHLFEKYHCCITGITPSERGVEIARQLSEDKNYSEKVQFILADGLNNGLDNDQYDIVWQMESSHLIHDKSRLFQENYRVLKKHGKLLLCDLILKRDLSYSEIYQLNQEIHILHKTFGKAKMETLKFYTQELKNAGFSEIKTVDISSSVTPTFKNWKKNIDQNQKNLKQCFGQTRINDFLLSCEIIKNLFDNNILGYGLVKATK